MDEKLFKDIHNIKQHKRHGEVAPHKPLLLLYSLAQWERGIKQISWNSHEERLTKMLHSVKPSANKMEEPFIRLARDKGDLWEITHYPANRDPSPFLMRELNVVGKLGPSIREYLTREHLAMAKLIRFILHDKFPEGGHEEILAACGLDEELLKNI